MDTELLIIDDESEIIIEVDTDVEVLEAAAQGPRGPQGIPGPAGGVTTVMVGATPANNGELVFERTSNTSLTLRLRGTDGVVRSVALTLA